nr:hypothetical protein [Paenibacillus allorhizoplanae]
MIRITWNRNKVCLWAEARIHGILELSSKRGGGLCPIGRIIRYLNRSFSGLAGGGQESLPCMRLVG